MGSTGSADTGNSQDANNAHRPKVAQCGAQNQDHYAAVAAIHGRVVSFLEADLRVQQARKLLPLAGTRL